MRFSAGPDGKPKAFRTAERQSRLGAVGLVCHHILHSSIIGGPQRLGAARKFSAVAICGLARTFSRSGGEAWKVEAFDSTVPTK